MNITKLVLGACNTNVYIVSSNKKNAILIDPADNAAEIIKTIEENNTVGIIICKQDNEYVIKYCSDERIIAREYELV